MLKNDSDPLFQLIKSLSKSEKRQFKLYAKRLNPDEEPKFLRLFDVLEQMKEFDDALILEKAQVIKQSQLSNVKAHLYKQILKSLKPLVGTHLDVELREALDFARILYNKGLYKQSLKVLDKAKYKAKEYEEFNHQLEILHFEKLIESQYITRSIRNRAEQLILETDFLTEKISRVQELSNVALSLYGLYLKVGSARNEEEFRNVSEFFFRKIPHFPMEEMGFYERLHFYQCHVWYNYIIQDFLKCYRYAQLWVDLFEEYPKMKMTKPDLFIKGLHNLLAALFNLQHFEKFTQTLEVLDGLRADKQLIADDNNRILVFQYVFNNRINWHFMQGTFSQGLELIPSLEEELNKYAVHLDNHRVLLFYYKIACLYFGSGDNHQTIKYLSKIIHLKDTDLREDIHTFARILSLIAHYELNNTDLLPYQIRSVFRFLVKQDSLQLVQKEILNFLKNVPKMKIGEEKLAFSQLKGKLDTIAQNPYERRAFLYLDISSWLESKIKKIPIQDVVQTRFQELRKRI